MPIEAVIFDLDGTITQPYLDFDLIRKEIGIPVDGGPILEAMEKMTEDEQAHAHQVLLKYETLAITESQLNEGARELLMSLRARALPVGILTRNTRANALAVAEKHNLSFNAILGREDATPKPDPAGVLLLCQSFQASPERTLMVGDYLHDVLCANAAKAVSVLLDLNGRSRAYAEYADHTVGALPELIPIIQEYESH